MITFHKNIEAENSQNYRNILRIFMPRIKLVATIIVYKTAHFRRLFFINCFTFICVEGVNKYMFSEFSTYFCVPSSGSKTYQRL